MIKQLIKYGMIAGIIYGLYYLLMLFPLEFIIIIGIVIICIVGYWISKLL
jgi:hypothetical protein